MVNLSKSNIRTAPKPTASDALGQRHELRAPKVAELVARELRNLIIRGELKAGDSLPGEIALMAHFGISRQTLREALRVLESEALVAVTRGVNGGPKVLAPDRDMVARHMGLILQHQRTPLADVFEARRLIEPPAARMVAQGNSKRAPEALRAIIAAQEALLNDDLEFTHATIRFHETLVELSGNQTLLLVLHAINGVLEKHISLITIAASQHGDTTADKRLGLIAQHKLVRLIEAGQANQAETFWQTNLEAIGKVVLRRHRLDGLVDVLD